MLLHNLMHKKCNSKNLLQRVKIKYCLIQIESNIDIDFNTYLITHARVAKNYRVNHVSLTKEETTPCSKSSPSKSSIEYQIRLKFQL